MVNLRCGNSELRVCPKLVWIGSFVPKAEVLPQARDVRSSPDSDRRFQIGMSRGRGDRIQRQTGPGLM
jgi:hypothetical protein